MAVRKAAAYIKREAEDIWELHGIYLHRSGAHLFSPWLISMVFFTLLFFHIWLGLCPYLFTFMTLPGLLSHFDHLSSSLCDSRDNCWSVSFTSFNVNPWVLTLPFDLCATAWPRLFSYQSSCISFVSFVGYFN